MRQLFCIIALIFLLFTSIPAQNSLPQSDNELGELLNWESGESYWDEENTIDNNEEDEWTIVEFDSLLSESYIAGNTPEQIGAAVKDGIVKIISTFHADFEANNAEDDGRGEEFGNLLNGLKDAVASLLNDLNNVVDEVGSEVGTIVTNVVNAARENPDDLNNAIGGAISASLADLGDNADEIGDFVQDAFSNAIEAMQKNSNHDADPDGVEARQKSSEEAGAIASSVVTAASNNAEAVGSAIGKAIGDAINNSESAVDAVGDSLANLEQLGQDNAENIGNTIGEMVSSKFECHPELSQEDIIAIKNSVSQGIQELFTTNQGLIKKGRVEITQIVSNAIDAVGAQEDDANKDVVGVINAVVDELINIGENMGNAKWKKGKSEIRV